MAPPTLSARSVVLSTLLGTRPPAMPVDRLVRACEMFSISDGTARSAISRMVSAGELETDPGSRYRLSAGLIERQQRQDASRGGRRLEWNGRWRMAVVVGDARDRGPRAELRRAAPRLRLAELRDGVWVRPDNLALDPTSPDERVVAEQCEVLDVAGRLDHLVESLWPLAEWSEESERLRREIHRARRELVDTDPATLAAGFTLSATVLRHFNADPLLPRELLARRWPGDRLRIEFDAFDADYREALAAWLGVAAPGARSGPQAT